jgi:hypothetical protein
MTRNHSKKKALGMRIVNDVNTDVAKPKRSSFIACRIRNVDDDDDDDDEKSFHPQGTKTTHLHYFYYYYYYYYDYS